MPAEQTIRYQGTTIRVWEQTIAVGHQPGLWLRRPVEDRDIEAVKRFIDAARQGLAQEIRRLREQTDRLIGI